MNFKEALKIDQHHLDAEWMRQPSLYQEWAEELAHAVATKDRAKERVELVKAELDKEIRGDPEAFEIAKTTETVIQATIIQQPEYKKVYHEYLEAKEDAAVLDGAVQALEHKRKALEKLVELYMAGYWAEPRVSKKVQEDAVDVGSEQVRRSLKRRKNKK